LAEQDTADKIDKTCHCHGGSLEGNVRNINANSLSTLAEGNDRITKIDETADADSDCCSARAQAMANSFKGN
jgi:hypothetical protein